MFQSANILLNYLQELYFKMKIKKDQNVCREKKEQLTCAHFQRPVSSATLQTARSRRGAEVAEGGFVGGGQKFLLTMKVQRRRDTVTDGEVRDRERGREGGRERRCMMGYEIKYSMSALFWSPPPSSTLTVPHWREGDGGGGGDQEGRRCKRHERQKCRGGGDEKRETDEGQMRSTSKRRFIQKL